MEPDLPDSSASDALLAHAAAKALEMTAGSAAAGPAAKLSGAARRDLAQRAFAVDWNRLQGAIRGTVDPETAFP